MRLKTKILSNDNNNIGPKISKKNPDKPSRPGEILFFILFNVATISTSILCV